MRREERRGGEKRGEEEKRREEMRREERRREEKRSSNEWSKDETSRFRCIISIAPDWSNSLRLLMLIFPFGNLVPLVPGPL